MSHTSPGPGTCSPWGVASIAGTCRVPAARAASAERCRSWRGSVSGTCPCRGSLNQLQRHWVNSQVRMIWSKIWDSSSVYFTRSDANCWIISTNVVITCYKSTDTDWDDLKENLRKVMIWVYHGLPMLQVWRCLTFKHTSTILLITF